MGSGLIRIVLEPLPGKCVGTVARERYWQGVDRLMKRFAEDEPSEDLEEEVETLRAFLETADVASVRRTTEEIAETGRRARVILSRDAGGGLEVHVHPLAGGD